MKFDNREIASILAGLRTVQRLTIAPGYHNLPEGVDDVLTSGGELAPLTVEEIDSLCERINLEPRPVPGPLSDVIREATEAWAKQFAAGERGEASEINGGDLLEWFSEWRVKAKGALAMALAMEAALGKIIANAPDPKPEPEDYDDTESAFNNGSECASWEAAEIARAGLAGNPVKLALLGITVKGGAVQDIIVDRLGTLALDGVILIDYDRDGADHSELIPVKQPDGTYSDAVVMDLWPELARIPLADIAADIEAKEAAIEAGWSRTEPEDVRRGFWPFQHSDTGTQNEAKTWGDLCKSEGIEIPSAAPK